MKIDLNKDLKGETILVDIFGQLAFNFVVRPLLWLFSPGIFLIIGVPAWVIGGVDGMADAMDKVLNPTLTPVD